MDPLAESWMGTLRGRLLDAFGDRVLFIGIQGSRARGESRDDSDIDAVVILDSASPEDLLEYRSILDDMPDRELACGFVSGADEIRSWDRADLFQFRMDTVPILGTLDDILPPMDPDDSRIAAHSGACAVYHAAAHNLVHDRSEDISEALFKHARFVLRAKHHHETGVFLVRNSDLMEGLEGTDLDVAKGPTGDMDSDMALLLRWSSEIVCDLRER